MSGVRTMKTARRGLMGALVALVVLLLAGCHGKTSPDPTPTPTFTGVSVVATPQAVALDPALPAALNTQIARVISPLDDGGTLASGVQVPQRKDGLGESMVVAVDANNNLLLASLTQPGATGTTRLSADSTALALVRLLIGAVPNTVNTTQLNTVILAAAEYPNLVAQIALSVAQGQAPANSSTVLISLATVVSQVPSSTFTAQDKAQVARATDRKYAQTILASSDIPATALPWMVPETTRNGTPGVFVSDASGDSLNLGNSTMIAWSSYLTDAKGAPICPAGVSPASANNNCSTLLSRNSLTDSLLMINKTWGSWMASSVAMGGKDGFDLTVKQDTQSKTANVLGIGKDLLMIYLAFQTGGQSSNIPSSCVNGFVDILTPPTVVAQLISGPSWDPVTNYFKDLLTTASGWNTLGTALTSCGLSFATGQSGLKGSGFLSTVGNFVTQFAFAQLNGVFSNLNLAFTSAGSMGQTAAFWSTTSQPVGVCVDPRSASKIVDCAKTLQFTPSALQIQPGDLSLAAPTLQALNAQGGQTLVPLDLTYESDTVSLIQVDAKTGNLTKGVLPADTRATVTITATDSSTGVKGSYTIQIGPAGFTKIALDGTSLPDTATTWSCVRHNATGLLWEAHVTRQTPPHPCTWVPALTCTGYTNFGDGSAYDASAVTGSVCGKPGRLPTEAEGRALVNDPAYGYAGSTGNPSYDAFQSTWFGADDMAWWGWTSSPVAGNPSNAWGVAFSFGVVYSYPRVLGGGGGGYGYHGAVRLVAGP